MLELVTCAQFVPSQDISMTTVAVPAVELACMTSAGVPALALMTSVVGPVVVAGDGAREAPTPHVLVAACAEPAIRTAASTNLALSLRSFERVFASAACRFVRVDALLPSLSTWVAYDCTPFPAAFALAVNAPGLFIAPCIQFAMFLPRESRQAPEEVGEIASRSDTSLAHLCRGPNT